MERLLEIMRRLRDPETGCPWDVRQNFASIAPYTIEEAYEVADAIHRGDMTTLRDELGDLLLQVVYHARMAEEEGAFSFADVIETVSDKMVRRHPHVFGETENDGRFGATEWERQKEQEGDGGIRSVLDGAARDGGAIMRATTLGQRAARVGFDWDGADSALGKVDEELRELREAEGRDHRREEFGDLLFALISVARHMRIDPESALRNANRKFERRFREMEQVIRERGQSPASATLEEMETIWRETGKPTPGNPPTER